MLNKFLNLTTLHAKNFYYRAPFF